MRWSTWAFALGFLAFAAHAGNEPAVSGYRIDTGRDFADGSAIFQRIGVVEPKKPRAIAILMAGGRGLVDMQLDGTTTNPNFLVRSRQFFADNRITAVVVDAPRDRQQLIHTDGLPVGLGLGYRLGLSHAGDIQAVIDFMRARQPGVPVFLVGTSRGSTSVAYATMHLKRLGAAFGPDGIVLSSTFVVPVAPEVGPTERDSLFNPDFGLQLAEIKVPTLIVHHEGDACPFTPYAGVGQLLDALSQADELELVTMRGGGPPTGPECEAFHFHGFVGVEEKTVKKMSHWIRHAGGGDDD
jgi:hypothetical protein